MRASGEKGGRLDGEQAHKCAADDILRGQEPPYTAIRACGAVVAHNKVLALGDCVRCGGAVALVNDVRLFKCDTLAIRLGNGDAVVVDVDHLAREPDDALDKKLARVARIAENDHVAALWRLKPVGKLVDNEVLAVCKRRVHAVTRDDKRLCDKKAYRKDNKCRNDDKLKEFGEKTTTALR